MARYTRAPVVVWDIQANRWEVIPLREIDEVVVPGGPTDDAQQCLVHRKHANMSIHVSRNDAGRVVIAQRAVANGGTWYDPRIDELFPTKG